jgi:phenylalanine-4-hydroxylase
MMTTAAPLPTSSAPGVAPVVYGQADRPPRGDYSRASSDYTCAQDYAAYTEADHDTYRRLYERQSALLPGLASQHFIDALPSLGAKDRIPRFEEVNERLRRATGWEIVGVPGLIPEVPFFSLLANRKFPVTDWIRKPEEFEYIVEPDVFHDLFGHVPLLFNPVIADYIQAYGQGGLDDLQQLFDLTAADFEPLYRQLRDQPTVAADVLLPGEVSLPATAA